jgi:hypothetical protein
VTHFKRWYVCGLALPVAAALISGCGGASQPLTTSGPTPVSSPSPVSSHILAAADAALIRPKELPQLTAQNSVLTAADFAQEAGDPALATRLASEGFQGAAKRELRGNSRDISGVDSRVLVFDEAAGAQDFVKYMAKNSEPFFGGPSTVKPLHVGDADGVLIVPPNCGCAGAYPVYAAVAADGNKVLWLEITGSQATANRLHEMITLMM